MVTAGVEIFFGVGFFVFEAVVEDLELVELFFFDAEGFTEAGFSGPAFSFSLASAWAFSFGSACMLATSTGNA